MAYTPNTWATGDTITAQKLNNMEQGIASAGGGAYVVNVTLNDSTHTMTCDKAASAIYTASQSGIVLFNFSYAESSAQITESAVLLVAIINQEQGYDNLYAFVVQFKYDNLYCLFTGEGDNYPTYAIE